MMNKIEVLLFTSLSHLVQVTSRSVIVDFDEQIKFQQLKLLLTEARKKFSPPVLVKFDRAGGLCREESIDEE